MKKLVLLILGAIIFYFFGAVTVRYKLFPYTKVVNFKSGIMLYSEDNYLKNNNYVQQMELYNIYKTKESKVVMLGDSLTFGVNWNELLDGIDVTNRGIYADTTRGFIQRLNLIYKLNPQYVFIMGGINDIVQGYKVDNIFYNYKIIIESLKSKNIIPVVQSTLFISNKEENKKVKKLNNLLVKYCKSNKIDFIDLNNKLSGNDFLIENYSYDGIHLKANGYKIWRNNLKEYFLKNM